MAGLGGKNWTFQEEVTSSDVNGYLADQVVMRFGGTAARNAGFGGSGEPTLAEGMISYLDDANRVDYYNGSAWKPVSQILQVVSTTKTDSFSTNSQTFVDVTGVSASITPSSSTSKILILVAGVVGNTGSGQLSPVNLVRNSTNIAQSTGATANATLTIYTNNANNNSGFSICFLDSPSTSSSTTYKLQIRTNGASSATIGRIAPNTDWGSITTITLIEVAE